MKHQSITGSKTVKIKSDTKVNSQSTKKTTRELQQVEYKEQDCYVETFGIGIPGISELRRG